MPAPIRSRRTPSPSIRIRGPAVPRTSNHSPTARCGARRRAAAARSRRLSAPPAAPASAAKDPAGTLAPLAAATPIPSRQQRPQREAELAELAAVLPALSRRIPPAAPTAHTARTPACIEWRTASSVRPSITISSTHSTSGPSSESTLGAQRWAERVIGRCDQRFVLGARPWTGTGNAARKRHDRAAHPSHRLDRGFRGRQCLRGAGREIRSCRPDRVAPSPPCPRR